MSRFVKAIVLTALFASHGAWAVCTADINMFGRKVLNVAASDDSGQETVSEAATLAYLHKMMDQRSQGNELSHTTAQGLTWSEALSFCANLISGAHIDGQANISESSQRLYNDWRLPSLDEWLAACHTQGSELKLHLEESGDWYKENKLHPLREWIPAGACNNESNADSLWWINRHSAETEEGEDLLYHGELPTDIRDAQTTHVDPLHHVHSPEPKGVVRNIAYGYPEAWSPTTSAIKKIKGDEKLAVRCIR